MSDPLEFLKYEDLDEPMQLVWHYCGAEVVKQMIRHLSGEVISVPAAKRIPNLCSRFIQARFNGTNVRQLARSLNSSTVHVRGYLRATGIEQR